MFSLAREQLGHAYLQLRMHDEAVAEFQHPAETGGADAAFRWLERAYSEHYLWLTVLHVASAF